MARLFAVGIFAGLRLSGALALVWGDIDRDAGVIRVPGQINDRGERVKLKAKQEGEARDVLLAPSLASMLRREQLASPRSQETDLVVTEDGGPLCPAGSASVRARRSKTPRCPARFFHDCRRTFVSLLVAQGRDIVFVAGQIGDSVQTVLTSYAWLFDAERHMDAARAQLDAEFGHLLGSVSDASA